MLLLHVQQVQLRGTFFTIHVVYDYVFQVPNKTGGDVFFYPAFNLIEHGEQLHYDISRHVLRRQAFGCSFKMRTSRGLTANQMYAAFDPVSRHEQSQFEVSSLTFDVCRRFIWFACQMEMT